MLKPALSLALLLLAAPLQQPAPETPPPAAPIPAADAAKVNPVKPTAASLAHARKMYGYDCAICHGAAGNGKGELSTGMNLKDYTDPAALHNFTDGELFYIIQNGRGQMPGEAARESTDEAWNMVILVRSFAHK